MKWSKSWIAAMVMVPGMFLASCGSGNNNENNSDTLSTQSPPPGDVNSSTSDNTNLGDSANVGTRTDTTTRTDTGSNLDASGGTGSTGATPSTGTPESTPGESVSGTERSVTGATGEVKKSQTKAYSRKKSSSARKSTAARSRTTTDRTTTTPRTDTAGDDLETTVDTAASRVETMGDTAANRINRLGDTAAQRMGELTDTAARKAGELSDTAGARMDRLADTSANRMRSLVDTSDTGDTTDVGDTTMNRRDTSSLPQMDTASRTGNLPDTSVPQTGDTSRTMSPTGAGMNFTPSIFIPDQIRSNYAEIKLARMAIDRSSNEEVKRIARTLENDHNALLRELQTLARGTGAGIDSIPSSEGEMARQQMDMMKNLSGQEFDRQWLQHMHMMHDQKVQMLEQGVTNNRIQDTQLSSWINKSLPTLRKHRDMLSSALNTSNR